MSKKSLSSRRFVRLFEPQFADLVEAGLKRQTVRPTPKRMPEAGDHIDCRTWTGAPYRSKQRRLFEGPITRVAAVQIVQDLPYRTELIIIGGTPLSRFQAGAFALEDGFASTVQFYAYFRQHYGPRFTGIVIKWERNGEG